MDLEVYRYLHLKHKRFHSKKTLEAIRKFLDCNNMKMPAPKWLYSEDDTTTWKYLDVIISDHGGYQMAIPNPDFKYGNL